MGASKTQTQPGKEKRGGPTAMAGSGSHDPGVEAARKRSEQVARDG
jgi:hypothetical protein